MKTTSTTARRFLLLPALGLGTWWILSLLVHLAFFGTVLVLTPDTPVEKSSNEFTMSVSPGRVREISEEIRQIEQQRLAEKLSELIEIKETLDKLNSDKIGQYNQVMQEEANHAPEQIGAAQAEVLAAQERALKAQARSEQALEKIRNQQAGVAENESKVEEIAAAAREAMEAQSEVKLAQSQAAAAQERIAHRLPLVESSAEAAAALSTAVNSQLEATRAQEDTESLTNKISSARKGLKPAEEFAAKETATLAKREEQLASALRSVTERQQALSEAQKKADDARIIAATNSKEDSALEKARTQLKQAEERVVKIQEMTSKQKKRTEDALAAAATRRTTLESALSGSAGEQRNSAKLQQDAAKLQLAADEVIAKVLANHNPDKAKPLSATEGKVVQAPDRDANLGEMYEKAQAAEQAIAETYRYGRAAELAAIRKIPLEDAIKLTEIAKPNRPAFDTDILKQDIADIESVRAQEKALTSVAAQMESMLALARRMRDLAAASESDLSLSSIQAKIAANERMEQLAMEEAGTRAKDLSEAMNGGDYSRAGGDQDGVSMEQMGVMHAAAAWGLSPFNPNALSELATAMRVAALTRRGGGGGSVSHGSEGWGQGVPGIAGVDAKDFRPIPGRTVRAGSVSIEEGRNPAWMYVDSWHLVGPWPNPRRKNLHTKFPPETVVDLDASYQGGRKDEVPMPIGWRFYQLPARKAEGWTAGMISPPGMRDFEIHYAYTELWFDQAMDLWVAIGSDDQSKVWLNDQLIWKSADYYKAWAANEGLRKVHFRRGINRVLYRLENGQLGGGFSFLVCLSEPR